MTPEWDSMHVSQPSEQDAAVKISDKDNQIRTTPAPAPVQAIGQSKINGGSTASVENENKAGQLRQDGVAKAAQLDDAWGALAEAWLSEDSKAALSAEEKAAAIAAISNEDLSLTTRNNLVAHLVNTRKDTKEQAALSEMLQAVILDPRANYLWRQYALQHFANIATAIPEPHDAIDILEQIVEIDSRELGGTALLMLHRMQEAGQNVDVIRMERYIHHGISSEQVSDGFKITCLGMCTERKISELREEVRKCVYSPRDSIARAAIRALGAVGDSDDYDLIKNFSRSRNSLMKNAAIAALAAQAADQQQAGTQ